MVTEPWSGCSTPARIFRRVVLPLPLAPMRPMRSPFWRSKEMPLSTERPAKAFSMSRISARAMELFLGTEQAE